MIQIAETMLTTSEEDSAKVETFWKNDVKNIPKSRIENHKISVSLQGSDQNEDEISH